MKKKMKNKDSFLRQKRKEKGLTLIALAKMSGISKTHISFLETKKRSVKSIRAYKLYTLAKILDVPMESFFEEVEAKEYDFYVVWKSEKRTGANIISSNCKHLSSKLINKFQEDLQKKHKEDLVIINIIK